LLATSVTALLCVGAVPQAQPGLPTALTLLDQYDRGEYDAVLQAFAAARDTETLRKDIEKNGAAWTASRGPALEARRRLVAATMALELAHARMSDQWHSLRSLVEWGCQLLGTAAPSDAERLWHVASIALAGGALDDALLFNARTGLRTYRHLSHAEERFPLDPRVRLASRFVMPGPPAQGSETFNAGLEPALGETSRGSLAKNRDKAIERLKELAGDPVVGAEAALRIGHLQLSNLKLSEALESFQSALRPDTTPYVAYLAHFLTGRTFERVERPDSAEQAYARALEAVPLAQSAMLARSALLTRAGRTDEAAALAAASFGARPRPTDPWRLFPRGDYYRWPETIAALRAELRR
jgi:tetratricopeptide (TPR) repeat protein